MFSSEGTPTFSSQVRQVKRDSENWVKEQEARIPKTAEVDVKKASDVGHYNYDKMLLAVLRLMQGVYITVRSIKAVKDDNETSQAFPLACFILTGLSLPYNLACLRHSRTRSNT